MNSKAIIVGVDGSDLSLTATRWAAREAGLRRLPLRVLHAYEWIWPGPPYGKNAPVESVELPHAQGIVAAAVAEARRAAPQVDVTGEAVPDRPVQTLLGAGKTAELVVVGGRGRGGFAELVLGSTGLHVATHADGPVAVVGTDAGIAGPVVVGVDGSRGTDQTLRLAFEFAAAHHSRLIAMRAIDVGDRLTGYGGAEAHVALVEQLAPWREKFPEVPVATHCVQGSAAHVLAAASRDAQVVVVGTRGHGGFTGLLLGSVGQQLLHHTACPVLIAR